MTKRPTDKWVAHAERITRSSHLIDQWSLFHFPEEFQNTFRILLLVPIGALMISILRNMIGFPTFGTFMPVLMALAFRSTGLFYGLGTLVGVILVGYAVRRAMDRMHLLLVPRMSVLLTLVIACFVGLALVGNKFGIRAFMAVGLLPFVILTMTIERFFVLVEESGPLEAFETAAGSAAVAVLTYEIIRNGSIAEMLSALGDYRQFVVKPARGSGGSGITLIVDRTRDAFVTQSGKQISRPAFAYYISSILSGIYSLEEREDSAIIEALIRPDPVFEAVSYQGVPDIRIVAYREVPVMGMVRLPTRASDGKANLHRGAIGEGVDMKKGITLYAFSVSKKRRRKYLPRQRRESPGQRRLSATHQGSRRAGSTLVTETPQWTSDFRPQTLYNLVISGPSVCCLRPMVTLSESQRGVRSRLTMCGVRHRFQAEMKGQIISTMIQVTRSRK